MAGKVESQHELRIDVPRNPVMYRNRPSYSLQRCALRHAATVSIARQHRLPMTAEVLRILPPKGVTGRAKTQHEHLSTPHGQCMTVCFGSFTGSHSVPEPLRNRRCRPRDITVDRAPIHTELSRQGRLPCPGVQSAKQLRGLLRCEGRFVDRYILWPSSPARFSLAEA